ncbi:HNH endonuclease signature motif containing protein [Corynebacterium vitaeruminis]|uniref:HNH endonuclease signature motif containing protein n=2 Tax=Corynebacterium vitaeruminis TaxID=38305 RepID=UPI0028A7CA91|nr:HNH endonuclease signature motif containing protein [Corynebacterium vitaeruminis]
MREITIEDGAFFAHRDPDSPLSMNDKESARRQFHQWFVLCIRDEDAENVDAIVHESVVACQFGVSNYRAGRLLDAMRVFHHMPVTLGRQLDGYPLDLERILSICAPLAGLTPEELAAIDEEVAFLITPTVKGQELPLKRKLGRQVTDIVAMHFGKLVKDPEEGRFLQMHDDGEGNTHLEAVVSGAAADVLQQCLEQKAAEMQEEAAPEEDEEPQRFSPLSAEVFEEFIRDRVTKYSVTLNLFTSPDMEGLYMPTVGFLSKEESAKWRAIAAKARDLSAVEIEEVNHYSFSERMQVYMKFRDDGCRSPGCTHTVCDHDHQVNYADGGKTSPSNGVLLCRSCHNMKSSGLVDYEVEDGVVKWRTPDGMVVTSYPAGVGRMFARTYHLRRRKQQERRQGRLVPELPPPF